MRRPPAQSPSERRDGGCAWSYGMFNTSAKFIRRTSPRISMGQSSLPKSQWLGSFPVNGPSGRVFLGFDYGEKTTHSQ
jgi:hypothetical protein